MNSFGLRLMHREAMRRLDDAEAFQAVRPDSDAGYLLKLLALELLLKFVRHTSAPDQVKAFGHSYDQIFAALPGSVQTKLLALAGERIGPSGLTEPGPILRDWSGNFIALRYPYEKYQDDTAEQYAQRGEDWIAAGASNEEAVFRFHPEELLGMLYALRLEADERLVGLS